MANHQRGANWSNNETWIIIRIGVYNDRYYLKENAKPCSSRAIVFVEILMPLGKVSPNTVPSFLENLNL